MSTYKVLQDIEAEDTLIGPLTLRQCLYAAIAVVSAYLCFIVITKGLGWMVLFLLPFVAFGAFFAFPWSKQQSTEVWALAKVRFYLKPRKRIWNQSGVKQLVTITVPKNLKAVYRRNLSDVEVRSRLKALADTIDSRGWAVKNVDMGYYTQSSVASSSGGNSSDRLLHSYNMPQEVSEYAAPSEADIFDVDNNATAQKLDSMMASAAGQHRQQLIQDMNQQMGQLPALPQPQSPVAAPSQQYGGYAPAAASAYSGAPAAASSVSPPANPAMLTPGNPAILELAGNNDLNVATIAREANARSQGPTDEIVVSLH